MMPASYSSEFLALQAALAGEYSLQRELGRGGMGVVYLARDVQLERDVAIKVMPAELAARAEHRDRFLREARTAAGLSHPHIVPIHRVGEAGGFVFFVMSYVPGETLGQRLRAGGPLPAAEVMRIMREVAWALAHAHGRGVVHRDVKPDNILLEEGTGRALVTDFGIASQRGATGGGEGGPVMGTAHFMSPEQANGEPVDGRADLYALGVVGYLASSGRLPFEAPSLAAMLARQATGTPPALAAVAPGAPAPLARAIDRCLERDPMDRFADGAALADALAPVADPNRALPAPLRHWLAMRNPAQWAYTGWAGLTSIFFLTKLITAMQPHRHTLFAQLPVDALMIFAPLVPITAFHVSQARRLFRAGYTLRDLRDALGSAAEERREREALERASPLTAAQQLLRGLTFLSAGASTVLLTMTDLLFARGIRLPAGHFSTIVFGSAIVTLLFLVAMNMAEVPVLPRAVRRFFHVGVRERLWRSALGEWLARRLGAPTTGHAVGAGVFRATEAALEVAALDLLAALPAVHREQLSALPGVVSALEARAAEARAEIEVLEAMGQGHGAAAHLLDERRGAATARLSSAVAALEGIRLDLLRLHAGAGDLAPLTTLLDAARAIGEDIGRIADARRDLDDSLRRGAPAARAIATPA